MIRHPSDGLQGRCYKLKHQIFSSAGHHNGPWLHFVSVGSTSLSLLPLKIPTHPALKLELFLSAIPKKHQKTVSTFHTQGDANGNVVEPSAPPAATSSLPIFDNVEARWMTLLSRVEPTVAFSVS